ncbi:MAG: hypothetical protein ABSA42_16995 [Terracidiphilus sp.]|jgi:hypothetical protein
MVVVPLSKSVSNAGESCASEAKSMSWVRIAAAGTLAASGVLLVAGKRRAGLLTAVTGAALLMLDQQEVVSQWWNALPGCLEEMQGMLGRAQAAVDDLSVQGEKLRRVLGK